MKRLFKRKKRIVKGTSSGLIVSLLFHGGLILAATVYVVIKHIDRPLDLVAPPPKAQPPAIPLQKIQPKVKNPSAPPAAANIVAKVDQVLPNAIQFPDMPSGGIGVGIGGGGGEGIEFPLLPTMDDDQTLVGGLKSIGNDLEGTYYDFKRKKTGGIFLSGDRADQGPYYTLVNNYLKNWDIRVLENVYRSPQKRYATCVVVPALTSDVAPSAFGEDRASGLYWMIHYKGQIVYPEDITFRFWGGADSFMGIRLNKEVIFFTAWQSERSFFTSVKWMSSDSQRDTYTIGGADTRLDVGDWITLKANEPQEIEIALGDQGGLACFVLLVEVKGVTYPKSKQNGPLLPIFKTADLSQELIDAIYKDLPTNECSLVGGPVFSDYSVTRQEEGDGIAVAAVNAYEDKITKPPESVPEFDLNGYNKWTLADGRSFEARYRTIVAGNVIMEDQTGKQQKVPFDSFTAEDIELFELARPPEFQLDIRRKSEQLSYSTKYATPFMPSVILEKYGVRAKKMGAGEYKHDISIEYFVIAAQRGFNDKFILVDHQTTSFMPTRENSYTHEFWSSRTVELDEYGLEDRPVKKRGKKYEGYLILLKDKRGNVIASSASSKWLLENLEELRKRDIGNYINNKCERVYPGRPLPLMY